MKNSKFDLFWSMLISFAICDLQLAIHGEAVTLADLRAQSYSEASPPAAGAVGKLVWLNDGPGGLVGDFGSKLARFFDYNWIADPYTSCDAAVSDIGSKQATLVIQKNCTFNSDATIPATLTLRFEGVGQITVATGKTVHIRSTNRAWPLRQIFVLQGTGKVLLESGLRKENDVPYEDTAFPQWWGGVPSGKDSDAATNRAAIQAAMDALGGGMVYFSPGNFKIDDELVPGHVALVGSAAAYSGIQQITAGKSVLKRDYGGEDWFLIRNMGFSGAYSHGSDYVIDFRNLSNLILDHVIIGNSDTSGGCLYLRSVYNFKITTSTFGSACNNGIKGLYLADGTISDNLITEVTGDGIDLESSGGITIGSNTITTNNGVNILIHNCEGHAINLVGVNMHHAGYPLFGRPANGSPGLRVAYGCTVNVVGGVYAQNAGPGVQFDNGSSGGSVVGAQITNNGTYGVQELDTSSNTYIGNIFSGNITAAASLGSSAVAHSNQGLADTAFPSNVVQTDRSNTYSGATTQDMSAVTALKLPAAPLAVPTAGGDCRYDSTASILVCGGNGSLTGHIPRVIAQLIGNNDTLDCGTIGTKETNFATTYKVKRGFMVADKEILISSKQQITTTNRPPTMRLRLKYGSSILYSTRNNTPTANLTNSGMGTDWTVRSTGSPGASAKLWTGINTGGFTGNAGNRNSIAQPVSATTNADATLAISLQCGAGTSGNSVTLGEILIWELY